MLCQTCNDRQRVYVHGRGYVRCPTCRPTPEFQRSREAVALRECAIRYRAGNASSANLQLALEICAKHRDVAQLAEISGLRRDEIRRRLAGQETIEF